MRIHALWVCGLLLLAFPVLAGVSMAQGGLEIQRDILQLQRTALESQLRDAQRCIQNGQNPQVLRDPEGNINRVPKIDVTNCSRTAKALTRSLASLSRRAAQLERDAKVLADASKKAAIRSMKSRVRQAAQQ